MSPAGGGPDMKRQRTSAWARDRRALPSAGVDRDHALAGDAYAALGRISYELRDGLRGSLNDCARRLASMTTGEAYPRRGRLPAVLGHVCDSCASECARRSARKCARSGPSPIGERETV